MPNNTFPYDGIGNYRDPTVGNSRYGFTVEEIIASMTGLEVLPGGAIVANGPRAGSVQIGQCVTKLAAVGGSTLTNVGEAGQWVPRKLTRLNGATAANSPTVTVDNASLFEIGDIIGFGGTTGNVGALTAANNRTIQSIVGNVITLTADAGAVHADNSYVIAVGATGDTTSYCAVPHGVARHRYTAANAADFGNTSRTVTVTWPARAQAGDFAAGAPTAAITGSPVDSAAWGKLAVIIGGMVFKNVLKGYEGANNLGLIDFEQGGSSNVDIVRLRVGATSIV